MKAVSYETRLKLSRANTKHGLSYSVFYQRHNSMTMRCKNPKNPAWGWYGGRGIKCLWESFEDFKEDMYQSFLEHIDKYGVKNTQIDRIDSNGHYCKDNCHWVTTVEQSKNRCNSTIIEFNGKKQNLVDWAAELKINKDTLSTRIMRGWSTEKLLTTPARKYTEFRI